MRSDEEIEADATGYAMYRYLPSARPFEHEEVRKAYLRGYADCRRKEQPEAEDAPGESDIEITGVPWDVESISLGVRERMRVRSIRVGFE